MSRKCKTAFFVLLCTFMLFQSLGGCKKKEPLLTNYKLFRNSVLSFQYPATWISSENGTNITVTGPQEEDYFVNMKFDYNLDANLPLEEFIKTVEDQNKISTLPGFVDGGTKKLDLIAGKAIQRSLKTLVNTTNSSTPLNLFVKLTYIVKDQKIGFVLTMEVPEKAYARYEEIFNNMLGSFRILAATK